jgi:hypothetical protein
MKKETIAMPDGRYLIYYTFDDEMAEPPSDSGGEATPTTDPETKDV